MPFGSFWLIPSRLWAQSNLLHHFHEMLSGPNWVVEKALMFPKHRGPLLGSRVPHTQKERSDSSERLRDQISLRYKPLNQSYLFSLHLYFWSVSILFLILDIRGKLKTPDLEIMGYLGGCYAKNHAAERGLENLRRLFDSVLFRAKLGKFSTKKPWDTEGSASLPAKTQEELCAPPWPSPSFPADGGVE